MSILKVEDLYYNYENQYQKVEALKGFSYEFSLGKCYAVIGKSGSGKSTLLSLLAGLDTPYLGDVIYNNTSTKKMKLAKYRRECVSFVYQDFRLFPLLNVIENIMYPMELCKSKSKTAKNTAVELAKKVHLPTELFKRYPSMISGGEQQRVALARALTMNRKIILADEPTGNLDSVNGNNIIKLLVNLAHNDNCCVIIATHDMSIVEKMDETIIVVDGKIQK